MCSLDVRTSGATDPLLEKWLICMSAQVTKHRRAWGPEFNYHATVA